MGREKDRENKELEKKQRDKLINSVMESLGEALGDDGKDIEEIDESEEIDVGPFVAESAFSRASAGTTNKFFVILAVFMLIFSVIGVINTYDFVYDKITDIRDRKALKEEFALFVYPVVNYDPPLFNSVESLQSTTIISCAVWKIILIGDKSNYTTDSGVLYIPEADVESAAYSLFGNSLFESGKFDHKSVSGSGGGAFLYNADNKNYAVNENLLTFTYSPMIKSLSNDGDLYTVEIDYMAPTLLQIAGIEHENEPTKSRVYTILRSGGKMSIQSIQPAVNPAVNNLDEIM
ncbi:MAG: hypothetical protein FWF82_04940 [Oscillospiraceae bacterium]|nr:hypothetical protein [Oscillospiraceae bacterium]